MLKAPLGAQEEKASVQDPACTENVSSHVDDAVQRTARRQLRLHQLLQRQLPSAITRSRPLGAKSESPNAGERLCISVA